MSAATMRLVGIITTIAGVALLVLLLASFGSMSSEEQDANASGAALLDVIALVVALAGAALWIFANQRGKAKR